MTTESVSDLTAKCDALVEQFYNSPYVKSQNITPDGSSSIKGYERITTVGSPPTTQAIRKLYCKYGKLNIYADTTADGCTSVRAVYGFLGSHFEEVKIDTPKGPSYAFVWTPRVWPFIGAFIRHVR